MKISCICGHSIAYEKCCGRYLDDHESAPTAEALMRSRYTAYTKSRDDYVLATWHHTTRPATLSAPDEAPPKWLGLELIERTVHLAKAEVLNATNNAMDPNEATVEFVARYKSGGGRARRLHEISRFVREQGRWFYVDGKMLGD